MTKEQFIQPRFEGERFNEHTLPVTAAKDLAAYEELVVELAKHLYRQNHSDRERVPKGFAEGFSLHLERIDDGSARPLLSLVVGATLFASMPPEIHQAKDLINKVISTAEDQPLPAEFPKDLYSYFNRIGRSLEPGERIEWAPDSQDNRAVLTPAKRKRLALAHRESYEADVDVVGLVEKLDTKNKTGTLRTGEGAILFSYDDPFFADIKEALGNQIVYAHIEGVGLFDVNDRLQSIKEIEQLECVPHYHLVAAIDALSELKEGWLEGVGVAPDSKNLSWLTDAMSKNYPDRLQYPAVVPAEDGNVIFEWMHPMARVELEVNFDDKQLELYATDVETDSFVEEIFDKDGWEAAFKRVKELVPT